jgi:hypothetical protein
VHDAREWAAPRLEDAATAVSETVAPKVSAALKATAKRVDPAPSKTRRLLWPGVAVVAVLVAAGAAVAVVLRKRQPPPPPYPGEEGDDSTAPASLDAEANGRVRQP